MYSLHSLFSLFSLSEKPSNTVTPFVTINNVNKKQSNASKQTEQQGEKKNNQTSINTEDDDFQDKLSSKVVAKGNKTKPTGSKVVVKATKGANSKNQEAKSKGTVKVIKCNVVAGKRTSGKAASRSKKALLKNAVAAKKGSFGYPIAGNVHMVQNFAVFADRSASAKIAASNIHCIYSASPPRPYGHREN